ncbi:MAG: T9SS type A sorting domain-containing protein, partial [bacterium]
WSGSAWIDTVIDAVSAATCGVAIGRGRNDDTVRVYGCNRNGEVWEFTHIHPYVGIKEDKKPIALSSPQNIYLYPNPSVAGGTVSYALKEQTPVEISIYAVNGAELITLVKETQGPGKYEYLWNGNDKNGHKLSAGVYFLKFTAGARVQTKAFILCE